MTDGPVEIRYDIDCGGEHRISIPVRLDPVTLERIRGESVLDPPEWTTRAYLPCKCCTLPEHAGPTCPAAVAIVELVACFGDMLSYTEAYVVVSTPQREIRTRTTVQRVLSSLAGLFLATSGCPSLAFLKPMARFHLPFASRQETLFRAASMHMLLQYFRHMKGLPCDMPLEDLKQNYVRLSEVNRNLADRLRGVVHGDANINAVVLLDLFAQDFPYRIDDGLAELETLFRPLLSEEQSG